MNKANEQATKGLQTRPDDIIDTETDNTNDRKDNVQKKLEGAEPSKDETEVSPNDAKISRSE